MRYLLDADWAIYVLAGRPEPATLLEQLIRTDGVGMSWVTVGELYEGAFGSSDAEGELAIYRRFLRPITLLNLDDNTMQQFARLRSNLRREGRLIPDLDHVLDPRYTRPKSDKFVGYPVWVEPDGSFSVAAVVWNVGQVTPVHDHGTWGVIGIYQGVEHEIIYEPAMVSGARLYKQTAERDLTEREVIVCCTSDKDIHRVSCGSNVPCVGIHVYGADIGTIERHVYDPQTGDVRPFVSGWTSVEE